MAVGVAALLAYLSTGGAALAQFETRANFFVSGTPVPLSVVVGDFSGDGVIDLAVVNSLSSTGSVEILLGNGDGTFRQGDTYVVGVFPYYGAVGSLRNNGILDLVLNDKGSDNVWVMLGNGDGTFQPAVAYPTTAESYMVALGDFTGNGTLDIIATEGYNKAGTFDCNCVEVLLGNGDGTFEPPITTTLPYGLTGFEIATGDFNGDGKLDVVAAGEAYPNYEAAILLGDGTGSFSADGYYPVNEFPASITTGHFTSGSNTLDVAVVSDIFSSLSVLLGEGNGTFQESVYDDIYEPLWVIAQDLDGDGKVDLAAATAGKPPGVTVYKGNGNGTFQKGVFYRAGTNEGGDYVAAGDFNDDGKPDLVVVDEVNGLITTLLNTGVVSFSPTTPLNFKKQAVGTTSPPQTVSLKNTGSKALKIASMKATTEFGVTSTCGASVAAGAKCTVSVTFSPTQKGAKQGTITIIDSASLKPQVIEVLGTGT